MICPHCGKQTANTSLCDHCGCSTEFAVRTNYQSVGTSGNEISGPPMQRPEPVQPVPTQNNCIHPEPAPPKVTSADTHRQQVSRQPQPPIQNHQSGYNVYPEQRIHSRKKTKVELLVPWLSGAVAILLIACIVATIAFFRLLKETEELNDQISSVTHSVIEEDIHEIPTAEAIADTLPEETDDTGANDEITQETEGVHIIFDVNPLEKMELYGLSPEAPEAIAIEREIPFLSDVSDSFRGYTSAFTGWNTKPDGTGLPVRPGQVFDLPLSESITLFAQWEELYEFRASFG